MADTPPEPRGWQERFSMRGRVVLLTGAAGGIGRVFAWALAEAGAVVAAADRTVELLDELREELARDGLEVHAYGADLTDVEACTDLVDRVHADHGRLDVLVNDAALMLRGPIAETAAADVDWVLAVNVRAPYLLARAAHRHMRDAAGGVVINIGSIVSAYALDTVSVYGLSKGAIDQFTRAAAVEWADDGVRVNCIAPGIMQTPMNAEALWADPPRRAWILDRVLLRRPGFADDLVGALLYLASDASAFVTGQTLSVNGGFDAGGSWDRQGPLAPPRPP